MRLYFIALQFLTIIPLPFQVRCDERDLGRSMALFPLVGLTLGGLLVGTDFLLARFLPRQVADLLLLTLLTVVTGALHLDGLADVCDGLAARGGRERFLAVMKDSRIGAVGVVGLTLGLFLKFQALLL
ncbi:MAG: adenosylcobinamide-GDP ribazoletransferase, partial [Geobacteraceae bacterium]|nr:adenosylcobinamide-GDP ribazoletransferase [Geobacteraceae bacterium]